MTNQTIIERIFQAHSPGDVPVASGNIIWLDLDVRSARDFAGANVVKNYRTHYGDASVVIGAIGGVSSTLSQMCSCTLG